MMNRILIFLAFLPVFAAPAAAQQNCRPSYELIFEMKDGRVGSYNVWDAVYGEMDSEERFTVALPIEGNHTVAAGMLYPQPNASPQLLLVQLDYRARKVWQQVHQVQDLERVVKMFPHEQGYIIFANTAHSRKRSGVWIGMFDKDGALLKSHSIMHPQYNLTAQDVVQAHDGKGYLLAALVEQAGEDEYGAVYKLDTKGHVIWDRFYLPGGKNRITGLAQSADKTYLAVGTLAQPGGRMAGWVMGLTGDGGILWQQQYGRGAGAALNAVQDYNERLAVVAGYADPAGGEGQRAGWVMMLNKHNGDILWQRYYTGSYIYAAKDVLVSQDGLISVLLDGNRVPGEEGEEEDPSEKSLLVGEEANYDYASLLTIDPRGILMISDAFYNGKGADATAMYFGPRRERILVGSTNMEYQIEAVADQDAMVRHGIDGWLVAAEETDPYKDPCKR